MLQSFHGLDIQDAFPDRLTVIEKLSQGAFGVVYLAVENKLKYRIAIKIQRLDNKSLELRKVLLNEINILFNLRYCDGVVKILECSLVNNQFITIYQYYNASLGDLQKQFFPRGLSNYDCLQKTFGKLLNILSQIHSYNIMHRDIKLENIMTKASEKDYRQLCKGEMRIADYLDKCQFVFIDFGVSVKLGDKNEQIEGQVGSSTTMAPEISKGDKYGLNIDVYSLGKCFQYLFGAGQPISDKQKTQDKFFNDYIQYLQIPDPKQRPDIFVAQTAFKQGVDYIQRQFENKKISKIKIDHQTYTQDVTTFALQQELQGKKFINKGIKLKEGETYKHTGPWETHQLKLSNSLLAYLLKFDYQQIKDKTILLLDEKVFRDLVQKNLFVSEYPISLAWLFANEFITIQEAMRIITDVAHDISQAPRPILLNDLNQVYILLPESLLIYMDYEKKSEIDVKLITSNPYICLNKGLKDEDPKQAIINLLKTLIKCDKTIDVNQQKLNQTVQKMCYTKINSYFSKKKQIQILNK